MDLKITRLSRIFLLLTVLATSAAVAERPAFSVLVAVRTGGDQLPAVLPGFEEHQQAFYSTTRRAYSENGEPYEVNELYFGAFETPAEAIWARRCLSELGYQPTGVYRFPSVSIPTTSCDDFEAMRLFSAPTNSVSPQKAAFEQVQAAWEAAEPVSALLAVAETFNPAENPAAISRARLLAALEMLKQTPGADNLEQPTDILTAIANGDVPAQSHDVAEARYYLGRIWHYRFDDHAKAARAYEEAATIARPLSHHSSQKLYAKCLLELCALDFELARLGKGLISDCRANMDLALGEVHEGSVDVRARIDLMRLETIYFDRDYAGTIAATIGFLRRYPEMRLESAIAAKFAGYAAAAQEDWDSMEEWFRRVVSVGLEEEEMFQWKGRLANPCYDVAVYMQLSSRERGHYEDAAQWGGLVELYRAGQNVDSQVSQLLLND